MAGERTPGPWVIAGTATGIYTHATLAALGLSAIVMRSSQLFAIVRLAGAAYLIGIGVLMLWRGRHGSAASEAARGLPWTGHHPYCQAVLANVLNPKAAAVYLTLAPQFLTARDLGLGPMLALATVHVTIMTAWLAGWSVAFAQARRLTQSASIRAWISRAGAATLIALGIRTAPQPHSADQQGRAAQSGP
jgi:threonine/homoserine/homoserine lactone efflux protein